nr:protein memo1 [Quercus suber]
MRYAARAGIHTYKHKIDVTSGPDIDELSDKGRKERNKDKMAKQEITREASHAGSWYTASRSQLNSQLEGWLAAVKTPIQCIGPESEGEKLDELPEPGARMIIAPYVC